MRTDTKRRGQGGSTDRHGLAQTHLRLDVSRMAALPQGGNLLLSWMGVFEKEGGRREEGGIKEGREEKEEGNPYISSPRLLAFPTTGMSQTLRPTLVMGSYGFITQ